MDPLLQSSIHDAIEADDAVQAQRLIDIEPQCIAQLCQTAPLDFLKKLNPQSIITYAILYEYEDYIKYIAETCPTMLNMITPYGIYPIHAFASRITLKKINILRTCISAGININQQSVKFRHTLLSDIIYKVCGVTKPCHREYILIMIKLLLESGANVNIADHKSITPLFNIVNILIYATEQPEYKIILELLIDYGADPYIKNNKHKNVFDYLDRWNAPTCMTLDEYNDRDIDGIKEIKQRNRDVANYLYQCLNKRIGKEMLAAMTTGYFLIIPRDIRYYIARFNYDYPKI